MLGGGIRLAGWEGPGGRWLSRRVLDDHDDGEEAQEKDTAYKSVGRTGVISCQPFNHLGLIVGGVFGNCLQRRRVGAAIVGLVLVLRCGAVADVQLCFKCTYHCTASRYSDLV